MLKEIQCTPNPELILFFIFVDKIKEQEKLFSSIALSFNVSIKLYLGDFGPMRV